MHVAEIDWPARCTAATTSPPTLNLSDTAIPISPAGQAEWVRDIIAVLQAVPRDWDRECMIASRREHNVLFSADWTHWPNVRLCPRGASISISLWCGGWRWELAVRALRAGWALWSQSFTFCMILCFPLLLSHALLLLICCDSRS